MALPLENCAIERQMPKGYTWVKFVQCWTGAPGDARFFEEKQDANGEAWPAAYFTTLVTYDRDGGWQEREVKLRGQDAVWACMELQERGQIALLSCEGHVNQRSFEIDGQTFFRSSVIIKPGSIRVHGLSESASAPTGPLPSNLPEEPAESILAQNTATLDNGLVEWPSAPSESTLAGLDDIPF